LKPATDAPSATRLRRVLLSSLEGAAISTIRIEGALHEFCSLPGVVEDVTDIILNLKKVLLKSYSREPRRVKISVKGPGEVTAKDIQTDGTLEVLNPDHHICTLDKDGKFEAELEIRIGRGYCQADWNKKDDQEIGLIPIDSLFSPVRRVAYAWKTPAWAVARTTTNWCSRCGRTAGSPRTTRSPCPPPSCAITWTSSSATTSDLVEFEENEKQVDAEREDLRKKLAMSVNEIELSVRAANCLNNANITTVGELAQKTEAEMLKYRNFGKKSLNEIKQKLTEAGPQPGHDV
jgi:DNA-directed RNA polymerase subunit alpha